MNCSASKILPEAGAKIWQITYLPLDTELLWNNPHIPPARHAIHAPYDDVWSGGWDELFPNDEETVIREQTLPRSWRAVERGLGGGVFHAPRIGSG